MDAVASGGSLTFTMTFTTPPIPPSAGGPVGITGGVEFDIDLSPGTGVPAFQDGFQPGIGHPPSGLGVEFAADLFSEILHPGLIDIVAPTIGGAIVGTVPILYGPLSLSFTVPLAVLGGDDDAAPATFATSSVVGVPVPGTLVLLAAGGIGVAVRVRRRARS